MTTSEEQLIVLMDDLNKIKEALVGTFDKEGYITKIDNIVTTVKQHSAELKQITDFIEFLKALWKVIFLILGSSGLITIYFKFFY
jgi:hypothetical protein